MTWSWGQAKATVNEFSWTNLSSVLFVEQPVGTGFSQGVPNIRVCFFLPWVVCAMLIGWVERGRFSCSTRRVYAAVLGSLLRVERQEPVPDRRKCEYRFNNHTFRRVSDICISSMRECMCHVSRLRLAIADGIHNGIRRHCKSHI